VCGRYIIREQEAAERYWRAHGVPKWVESFNVAPTATVPIIRRARRRAGESGAAEPPPDLPNEAALVRWGLVPFWANGVPPKYATFNARVEGLESTASFRGAWERGRRCILPAAGFYEWQRRGRWKQPFFIKLEDREIFGFAGLWERSKGPQGWIDSCTIITLPANRLLSEIHNGGLRMPAILREEDHEAWLAGTLDDARRALQPYADDRMLAWPVSPRVNSAKIDDEALTRPVEDHPDDGKLL
jgi:putative SOS response-associated peptidase YedK